MSFCFKLKKARGKLKTKSLLIALLFLTFLNINCGNRESKSYSLSIYDDLSIGAKEGSDDYIFGLIQDVCTDDKLKYYK